MAAGDNSFLDGPGARLLAGLVALVALGILVFMNWSSFNPAANSNSDEAKLNPEFVACRDARLATVVKMKQDRVISEQQFEQFSTRAVETCAGQFPPGG